MRPQIKTSFDHPKRPGPQHLDFTSRAGCAMVRDKLYPSTDTGLIRRQTLADSA